MDNLQSPEEKNLRDNRGSSLEDSDNKAEQVKWTTESAIEAIERGGEAPSYAKKVERMRRAEEKQTDERIKFNESNPDHEAVVLKEMVNSDLPENKAILNRVLEGENTTAKEKLLLIINSNEEFEPADLTEAIENLQDSQQ